MKKKLVTYVLIACVIPMGIPILAGVLIKYGINIYKGRKENEKREKKNKEVNYESNFS